MKKNTTLKLLLFNLFYFLLLKATSQPLAFPTAEGYGKFTVGGRGGAVYEVTNLNDSGVGSLRAAIEASGPRTVVFRVSGTITLNSNLQINNSNITIAGQTAPGAGICIKKYPLIINADQVIIRYIRVRYGDELLNNADAMSMRFHKNIILDHISASWGDDETMSIYHGENVTVQWCIISETLNRGGNHGFAGIWGSNYSTFHHNLVTNCVSRNMRFASGSGNTDYRNNVIYNWGYNTAYGGEQQQVGDPNFNFTNINIVNNYYKPGPATEVAVNHRLVSPSYRDVKTDYGKFYVAGNYIVGNPTVTADNWNGGVDPQGGSADISYVKLTSPWASMAINTETAQNAYQSVLNGVGCSLPQRDAVDTRIITEVQNGTSTYGTNGIIQSQTQVGGWPALSSSTAPADNDHDGMADSWEAANGLNPASASDRNLYTLSSTYTNLEVYINALAGSAVITPTAPLIKLGFNENTGTSIANTGSALASFSKSSIPVWSLNVPTGGGASSVDFGTNAGNYYIESNSVISQLGGLSNFTITGWLNCRSSTVGAGGNRVISWINNGGNGVDVVYLADGSLKVGVNQWPDNSTAVSNTGKITASAGASASNWKFFAITYQASSSTLTFYFGDNSAPASLDKTITYNRGIVGSSVGRLAIGHFNTESGRTTRSDRMFKGLIDQIQVFSTVLTPQQLQSVQTAATTIMSANRERNTSYSVDLTDLEKTDIVLYPNPVTDILNIALPECNTTEDVKVTVLDVHAKVVINARTRNALCSINMATLPSGFYWVQVIGPNVNCIKPLIKK